MFMFCFHLFAGGKDARRNKLATKFVVVGFPMVLLFLISGCTTMSVAPLKTGNADSYTQHEQKNGLVIGIRPMTDKREIKDMFKNNLLDNGLLPILVVAENQSASASFIIAKEKVFVLNEDTGTTNRSQTTEVASGDAGTAIGLTGAVLDLANPVLAAPLVIAGMKMASNATVIQYNLADKEYYSRTLGPGEKAQGFVYFQFPNESPLSGNYHIVAEVKNSATGEATTFDFPVNLTLTK
jgi:hypothetical protein